MPSRLPPSSVQQQRFQDMSDAIIQRSESCACARCQLPARHFHPRKCCCPVNRAWYSAWAAAACRERHDFPHPQCRCIAHLELNWREVHTCMSVYLYVYMYLLMIISYIVHAHILWRAVDDMGSRIDELEKSIGELMTQAGIEESQPQLTGGDWPLEATQWTKINRQQLDTLKGLAVRRWRGPKLPRATGSRPNQGGFSIFFFSCFAEPDQKSPLATLVCSWKIEVWTVTGLLWGLQAKESQQTNSGKIEFIWTPSVHSSGIFKCRPYTWNPIIEIPRGCSEDKLCQKTSFENTDSDVCKWIPEYQSTFQVD